jgi:hypothetical protein
MKAGVDHQRISRMLLRLLGAMETRGVGDNQVSDPTG